ncbi:hypothetical protein N8T08_001556 [Aspergillus melleus]|uniref:Uncharacterized protein n=1 Tax=Aspergillus melleus TaxID=138277 RepID=A0ACC3BAK6_9EURO|nr:hypothetical protein N8T08_001556 [Aspergillus melleus]
MARWVLMFTAIGPHVIHRDELIDEVITRLQFFHLVRVRGTPASGKTTIVHLLANKLLERDPETPLYILYGWDQDEVQGAEGWDKYLEQKTGVDGRSWLGKQGYLLIDEAQQSYWDSGLWATLFKAVEPAVSLPYIVLFTSYGSPTRGFSGFERKHMPTPMVFAADQQISLWPDANIEPPWRPIGLLLDEDEAIEVVERYAPCFIPNCAPILTQDLKRGLFKSSNGHIGLITSLVQALRGLPPLAILQFPTITSVLKEAVVHDGLYRSSFRNKSEELQEALHNILANGWLHAENAGADEQFKFASQIHRWYCQCIFSEKHPDNQLNYVTPLELTLDAIRRFQPCQLAQASRSLAEFKDHLYHVVFSEQYRKVTVIDASDLCEVDTFVLMENTN